LKFLLDQRLGGEDQQKWVSKLIGYDFDIKYRAGRENQVGDALSRKIQFLAITTVTTTELEDRKRSSKRPKAGEHYPRLVAELKPVSKL